MPFINFLWILFYRLFFFTGSILAIWTTWLFFKFQRKQVMLEEALYEEVLEELNLPSDLAYLQLLAREKAEAKQQILTYKSRENEWQSLVKMWSHQMKVPLAALSLMSQTNQINPTALEHQLLRLDNYMANLLNYMKLSNQVSDFRFEIIDVKDIVIELVKKYRGEFLQKEMTVEVLGTWQMKSDRKWLSFALSQVIDNAIKYSQNGDGVSIQLENGILISDQGIGILPEDVPRLFEEGFTGYNGREHQKASGFGLYLTKRVLTQLELSIQVTSQIDQGTQVRIWQEK